MGTLARADSAPAGQFLPSLQDRDGDGLLDLSDCAPDDPSRPARAGIDLDCNGAPDDGGGIEVGISGPVDGGPDEPGEQQAASRPSSGTATTRSAARDAAGEAVVAVTGLRLGPSIAVYEPARGRSAEPTLVFAAKGNSGLTVEPELTFTGGGTRALKVRARSLPRGRAYVVRLRLSPSQRRARKVRFAITVVDGQGDSYRATRAVTLSAR